MDKLPFPLLPILVRLEVLGGIIFSAPLENYVKRMEGILRKYLINSQPDSGPLHRAYCHLVTACRQGEHTVERTMNFHSNFGSIWAGAQAKTEWKFSFNNSTEFKQQDVSLHPPLWLETSREEHGLCSAWVRFRGFARSCKFPSFVLFHFTACLRLAELFEIHDSSFPLGSRSSFPWFVYRNVFKENFVLLVSLVFTYGYFASFYCVPLGIDVQSQRSKSSFSTYCHLLSFCEVGVCAEYAKRVAAWV